MEFIQQIILLLSEPPGNVIYHLVTLFALQAVFAISYSRWRRSPDDELALHMTWASGIIFIARILFLFIGIYISRNPENGGLLLPPLEQALNTMTIGLVIWSMATRPSKYPRSLDIILIAILVLTAVMALFFTQEWQNLAAQGVTYYNGTTQATVWLTVQIIILICGLIYYLINPHSRKTLPPIIVTILLLGYVVHLWNYPELVPTDTNIPYWIRLGYLIIFPLWAVFAYQHALTPLLAAENLRQTSVARFKKALDEGASLLANPQQQSRIIKGLIMSTNLMHARFSAIGLIDQQNRTVMHFQSDLTATGSTEPKKWNIDLAEHGTLRTSLNQRQVVQFLPRGIGSRQLHQFYQAMQIDEGGPLLVHPLKINDPGFGLLVIAGDQELDYWPEEEQTILAGLAHFLAQAIVNSQSPRVQPPILPPQDPQPITNSVPAAILLDQILVNSLESERDELRKALQEMEIGKKVAEEKALAAQKQARYLAAALRAAQQGMITPDIENQDDSVNINEVDQPTQPSQRVGGAEL